MNSHQRWDDMSPAEAEEKGKVAFWQKLQRKKAVFWQKLQRGYFPKTECVGIIEGKQAKITPQTKTLDEFSLGRDDEWLIYGYGEESLERYGGVVILGREIPSIYTEEKDGLRYTSFNRTLVDSLKNESILDMQGITEALSRYYYTNNEGFDGLFLPSECEKDFSLLAKDAIEYYDDGKKRN